MKKLLLSLTTTMTILLTAGTLNVSAETYGDINYKIENGEAVIRTCKNNAVSVNIPSEIEGYPVTTICDSAFSYCSSLKNVTIPNSVTSIGNCAFASSGNLESIAIPNTVKSIGEQAFYKCTNLKSVNLPNGITSIEHSAFNGCSSLTSIEIPNSVTNIDTWAFIDCTSLTNINISSNVTSIGEMAFYGCNNLKTVYYGGSQEQWNSISVASHNSPLINSNIVFNYNPITVTYNGEKIIFDQEPIIENGRTLVPLRAIFEKLGAEIEWNGTTQTVIAKKADTTIELTINHTEAKKNGITVALDVPAQIINDRTLVPVRFVSDCFGVGVEWIAENRQVVLTAN